MIPESPPDAELPVLKPQEPPYDSPESRHFFVPTPEKPAVVTPAAIEAYTVETVVRLHHVLMRTANEKDGLDYLQIFDRGDRYSADLWFIEDGQAITALLPSDY